MNQLDPMSSNLNSKSDWRFIDGYPLLIGQFMASRTNLKYPLPALFSQSSGRYANLQWLIKSTLPIHIALQSLQFLSEAGRSVAHRVTASISKVLSQNHFSGQFRARTTACTVSMPNGLAMCCRNPSKETHAHHSTSFSDLLRWFAQQLGDFSLTCVWLLEESFSIRNSKLSETL